LVLFNDAGEVTFSSGDEYVELLGVYSYTNVQNNLSSGSNINITHPAARAGYHAAYTYVSTHPNMYVTKPTGAPAGANSWHYGLQVTGSTTCRLTRAFTQYLPLPRFSSGYHGLTHTGRVDAQVIVWQIPN